MADKRIQDLTPASSVQPTDLFVLEQSGAAKSLSGQILIDDLAAALDGHGGINSITYTPPVGASLDGTLTITLADETSYSLYVTNGRGISNIVWSTSGVSGDGQYHNGTIQYNDGTTSTVQIRDGLKGAQGVQTYVWIRWAQNYPTQDSDIQNSVAPYIGIYTGTASTAPTAYTAYTWYQYKGDKGDTGDSLESIELTSTAGLVDTYTVYLTGHVAASTFAVTNAKSITSVTMISGTHAAGTSDVYEIAFNDGDTATFSVYNGANGLGSVSSVSGIQADGNGNVPQVISGNGAPTTATVGQENQLYYDLTNSVLYYCAGESQGTYVWLGAGVTVDSTLSGSSTNPVQNSVITNRVGTGVLPNSNTNLTAAINYVDGRIPSASTTTPQKDGTGAAGTGTTWARSNHVHPLNVATSGVPSDLGTASLGSADTYARTDHVHNIPPTLSSTPPADTSTVSDCLAYAQNNPDKIFCWARYNAATYTPGGVSSNWVYTLYTTYTSSANYVVFEAQNNTNGEMFRAKQNGTWADLTEHLPAVTTVSLPLSWVDSGNGYYTVTPTVSGATITARSKVNLQPTAAQTMQLQTDGVSSLYIDNNAGTLTAYAVGNAPSVALTMQCTVETTDSSTGALGDAVSGGGGGYTSGTDGIWSWVKYDDGRSECYGVAYKTTGFAVWTAPIYYGTTYTGNQAYPTGLFVAEPSVTAAISHASFDAWLGMDCTHNGDATKSPSYYPLRIGNGSSGSPYYVAIHAKGRWK